MIIFPDIEIQDGHCVNRIRGKEQEPEKYDISPMDAAKQFVAAGAERLHVIDVESSLKSGGFNHDLICAIIDSVDVPVQVGGGIQTQSDVDWWFDHGAARVVLGTVAVKDRLLTMEVCNRYPGKIVISITGKDGHAMIDSWQTKTSFTPLELAKSFEESGAGAIIYADLDRFEGGQDVGLASTIEIGTELNIPLISTGTIYSLDDVSTLALLPNIEGVIIGRALFNGTVDLAKAIETARAARVAPELADDALERQALEVELQAARQDGRRQLLRVGRGQQEDHVRRRLLEGLEQRVEAVVREHVHLVDEVHLVTATGRRVLHVLEQLAGLLDLGARRGIDLDQVDEATRVEFLAAAALPARLGANARLAVECLGEDARDGGLADAARTREEVGVVQAALLERVDQRLDHVLLADQFGEAARAPLAGQDLVAHRGTPPRSE